MFCVTSLSDLSGDRFRNLIKTQKTSRPQVKAAKSNFNNRVTQTAEASKTEKYKTELINKPGRHKEHRKKEAEELTTQRGNKHGPNTEEVNQDQVKNKNMTRHQRGL